MTYLLRLLACLLLVTTACSSRSSTESLPRTASPAKASDAPHSDLKPAHDFTLSTFEGDTFTLSDHFGELPVVLNFWAPW